MNLPLPFLDRPARALTVIVSALAVVLGLSVVPAAGGISVSAAQPMSVTIYNQANDRLGSNAILGIFVTDDSIYTGAQIGGVNISSASTISFTNYTAGLGSEFVQQVFVTDDSIYAATYFGLSISAVNPVSFTNYTTDHGLGSSNVTSVFVTDDTIYAGTAWNGPGTGGLSISAVHPVSFTTTRADDILKDRVYDVFVTDDTIYIATEGGLGISTDGGATFTYRTNANSRLGDDWLLSVVVTDDTIYAATRAGGLSISIDGGATFTNRTTADGLGSNLVSDVMVIDDTVYAATGGGLSISTDGGASFTTYSATGFAYVSHLFATASNIYLAGENVGLGVTSNPPSSTPGSTPTISGVSPATGPTTGGTSVTITGTNLTGATSVTFAGSAATITSNTSTQIVATTPAGAAGAVSVAVTTGGGTATSAAAFTYASPSPPDPKPPVIFPPGAPTQVIAAPGDGQATVSWTAPQSSGSFPITDYQAYADPGGHTCLVSVPLTSCTIKGLTNGTEYSVTVRALNGAGWGSYSLPATVVTPSIMITGTRGEVRGRPGIIVSGVAHGLAQGVVMHPWVKFPGQTSYQQGAARIGVDESGEFTWQRRTGKKIYISLRSADGEVHSNRLIMQRR
jgi:hypothetical protein